MRHIHLYFYEKETWVSAKIKLIILQSGTDQSGGYIGDVFHHHNPAYPLTSVMSATLN